MKKSQIIIYTRNRDIDYRMVIKPDDNLCPQETRKYFHKLIRGAIDVETYDDPLDCPRWLFARKDNVMLFGMATMLDSFSTDCCTDFTGRRVRGFYGIIIDGSLANVQLPYNFDFFREINKQYIEPLWAAPKEDFIRKGIETDINVFEGESLTQGDETVALNTDPTACRLLGNIDMKAALQSALTNDEDISLISGLNSKQHAIAAEADYDFMNAIVNGVSESRTIRKKREDEPPVPLIKPKMIKPKKDSRLKLVLTLLAVAVVIILLLTKTCSTTQTSPNSSTSGETDSISHQNKMLKKN